MAEHWRHGGVNVNRKTRGLGTRNRTMNNITNYLTVAKKVAEIDGQIEWDSLPSLLKLDYERQVSQVIEALSQIKEQNDE